MKNFIQRFLFALFVLSAVLVGCLLWQTRYQAAPDWRLHPAPAQEK